MRPATGALIGVLTLLAAPALAAAEDVGGLDASAAAFEQFMRTSRTICRQRPAEECVALAWRLADTDADLGLSVAELTEVRTRLGDWLLRHAQELSQPERSSLVFGLLLAEFDRDRAVAGAL